MADKGYPGFELKVAAQRRLNKDDAIMLLREEQALRKVQKAELIARIEQVAQLTADCTGYRQRLEAANKTVAGWSQIVEERETLRAQVKALRHELDILATVLEMENSKTTKGYWLRDLGKQARAALKAQA